MTGIERCYPDLYSKMYQAVIVVCLAWLFVGVSSARAVDYALTIDDPHATQTPLLTPYERNHRILKHLRAANKRAILFVCGKRVDYLGGKQLLRSWVKAGHHLANHSYSHLYYHSRRVSALRFQQDALRNHELLGGYSTFLRLFRFPFLKEGNTLQKRDAMRQWMQKLGYRNGHVTIDASDWYIDQRLRQRLKQSPKATLTGYRDYYLAHMWDRASYYDGLAKRLLKRQVKHTILIHHNLLNALFLGDLIKHLRAKGWHLMNAKQVYKDKLFQMQPTRLPAGESLIWSLARQRGIKGLRYPAESGKYEKAKMIKYGL